MFQEVIRDDRLVEKRTPAAVPHGTIFRGALCPFPETFIPARVQRAVTELAPLGWEVTGIIGTFFRDPFDPVFTLVPAEDKERWPIPRDLPFNPCEGLPHPEEDRGSDLFADSSGDPGISVHDFSFGSDNHSIRRIARKWPSKSLHRLHPGCSACHDGFKECGTGHALPAVQYHGDRSGRFPVAIRCPCADEKGEKIVLEYAETCDRKPCHKTKKIRRKTFPVENLIEYTGGISCITFFCRMMEKDSRDLS